MLDITAFSNALRRGRVSFLDTLRVRPFVDSDETVVCYTGDDAVVYPLVSTGDRPQYALRLPLQPGTGRAWPVHYADLVTAGNAIAPFLPAEITILDVEDIPGLDVALLYDWVPGETLTTRVTRARARHDRDQLADLLRPLADLGDALHTSGMVHGDIAPGNIIVRPDGGMTLIDLDRMGYRDAGETEARRRVGYRIPRSGGQPVEEDAFALLVLMSSCAILADSSVPIDHERAPEASHPTLLFSSWDLMDPRRSRLVRDVEGQLSSLTGELLDLLIAASSGRPERMPGLLRDAIRQIRRHGPEPDRYGTEPQADYSSWFVVATPESPADPVEVPAEWGAVGQDDDIPNLGSSWPKPVENPARNTRSEPARRQAPASVDDVLERLQSLPEIEPRRAAATRRAARVERRRQEIARELQTALAENDRTVLVRLAMSGSLAELGDSDRSELVQVVRALAHDSIERAVAADDDGMIVAAVDESVFEKETDLDPAFRERVRLARARVRWSDRLLGAVRSREVETCVALMREAPDGAMERLPGSIREQASRLVTQWEAASAANAAIGARDADGLARALGRLVVVRPVWMDHVDPAGVVTLLGQEQIEERLVARLVAGTVADGEQWMVDIVLLSGRLPEVTRLAGLTPAHVDAVLNRGA